MSSYRDILDGEIEAYKPVRYRLMRRYATNPKVIPVNVFAGTGTAANDTTQPGTYTTVESVRIWVPDSMVGTGGTLLVAWVLLTVNTSGTGQAFWALEHSGDLGAHLVSSSGGMDSIWRSLTMAFTPTGNDYETINIQVRAGAYIQTWFDWDRTECASYLEPLPR